MIERPIKEVVDYSIKHFPCTILTGTRQVGKSTLLTSKYENKGFSYVSLDDTAQKMLGHRMGILGCSTAEMKMSLGCR